MAELIDPAATHASAAPTSASPIPIVALDVPDRGAALALVDRLGSACRFYKIGLELFTAAGPDVVAAVRERGADVFLDLKFHDIPNTVAGAVRSAAALGVRLVTVHAIGGPAMLAAAAAASRGTGCDVLGVTVLTSLDAAALAETWGRSALDVGDEVRRLAAWVAEAGLHGVVCSGQEAGSVRARWGGLATLVPGVRPAGVGAQDQARVVTPRAAAAAGATYVVLGRAVTTAPDPAAALGAIVADLHA